MASQGPLSVGTGANDASFGVTAWTDPTNITTSDNTYATVTATTSSQYLKATNFGFSIPAGSTIDGIKVEVERKTSGADTYDLRARIVKGGTIGATDKSQAAGWPTVEAYQTYGSTTELWGETWTATDINSSNFGFALSCQQDATRIGSVDHVRITVYYTAAASSSKFALLGVG